MDYEYIMLKRKKDILSFIFLELAKHAENDNREKSLCRRIELTHDLVNCSVNLEVSKEIVSLSHFSFSFLL